MLSGFTGCCGCEDGGSGFFLLQLPLGRPPFGREGLLLNETLQVFADLLAA
jgi:hypothetical protein